MYRPDEIRAMAAAKKYFKPHWLLNLDNVFPKEMLYRL